MLTLMNNLKKLNTGKYSKKIGDDYYLLEVEKLRDFSVISFKKNGVTYYSLNIEFNKDSMWSIFFPGNKYSALAVIDDKSYMTKAYTINCKKGNNSYHVLSKSVSKVDSKANIERYEVINNYIVKSLSDKISLRYNLLNDKIEVTCGNLFALNYSDILGQNTEKLNNIINDHIDEFMKDSSKFVSMCKLFNDPEIYKSINIDELKEVVQIYRLFKNKFNILNSDNVLNNLNVFVSELVKNPNAAKINDFKTFIDNNDLTDKDNLKKAKLKLNKISTKKTKGKVLKKTK